MENTPRETAEGPVLLRWEMPPWNRRLLFLIPLGFAAGGMMLGGLLLGLFPGISSAYPFFVIIPLFWWYMSPLSPRRYIRALRCTRAGAVITTVSGASFSIPWEQFRSLREAPLGLAVVSSYDYDRQHFYMPIPPDVRDQLIAILRETSNARIIGFGTEES